MHRATRTACLSATISLPYKGHPSYRTLLCGKRRFLSRVFLGVKYPRTATHKPTSLRSSWTLTKHTRAGTTTRYPEGQNATLPSASRRLAQTSAYAQAQSPRPNSATHASNRAATSGQPSSRSRPLGQVAFAVDPVQHRRLAAFLSQQIAGQAAQLTNGKLKLVGFLRQHLRQVVDMLHVTRLSSLQSGRFGPMTFRDASHSQTLSIIP